MCVCVGAEDKPLSSIITALCVCEITLLLHTSMFIITQKHTPLIHDITTSPPLATLSKQPSVCLSLSPFIILSESRTHLHKAGFELQSCKVSM